MFEVRGARAPLTSQTITIYETEKASVMNGVEKGRAISKHGVNGHRLVRDVGLSHTAALMIAKHAGDQGIVGLGIGATSWTYVIAVRD